MLLYLSVLLHEVSHALMALRFGLPVRSITLHFLGGVTEIEGEADTPGREFWISVVGPLTSIGVGLVAYGLLQWLTLGELLSLAAGHAGHREPDRGRPEPVPGLPLDGGRVLRAAVWKLSGNPHRGTIVAGWGGRVAAAPCSPTRWRPWRFTSAFADADRLPAGARDRRLPVGRRHSAIMSAKVRRRLPVLTARGLARRALTVPPDLPLSRGGAPGPADAGRQHRGP